MKMFKVSVLLILCIAFTVSENESNLKKNKAKTNTKKDVVLTNDPVYKSPMISQSLPPRQRIETGVPENAVEMPTDDIYYDGQLGIRTETSFCNQFISKPQACTNQGNCGWCMGNGTCVKGTASGPSNNGDCLRGTYVFEAPNKDWNPISLPNTKVKRANIIGAQLTTVVEQP